MEAVPDALFRFPFVWQVIVRPFTALISRRTRMLQIDSQRRQFPDTLCTKQWHAAVRNAEYVEGVAVAHVRSSVLP